MRWGSVDSHQIGVTIGCDNVAGGRMAGEHLIARGRRRVGFIGDADDHYPEFRDRYRGLGDALRAAGLPVHPGLHADALSVEQSGYDATRRLLARDLPFDALFAASDLIALGAVRALTEAGRRVPEDVAIIGFDDIPAAATTQPPLTTIAQDYRKAGEVLVDTLLRRIADQPTDTALLQPRLIVRGST